MPTIAILYLLLKGISSIDPDFGKETETIATISHSFSGCFTSGSDKLILYRTDTAYFATLQISNQKSRTLTISQEQATIIFNFIKECRDRKTMPGGCTSLETYRIETAGQQFSLTDGTCIWRGFDKLQKQLLPLNNP